MAYRRRYYKGRRYGRRGYKFSKMNLYVKRSPKQQANQIYRLNRKVNAIEYRTKPEVKIFDFNTQTGVGALCGYTFGTLTGNGTFLSNIQGTMCRLQNITVYPTLYMAPDYTNTTYTVTCRIVIYQLKQPSTYTYSLPEQIFNITAAERSDTNTTVRKRNYMKAIYGPLKHGIASDFTVLKDFRLTISGQRNQKTSRKIVLKKGLKNIYINPSAQEGTHPKGYVGWLAIFTNNYGDTEVMADSVYLLMNEKIAYVDES